MERHRADVLAGFRICQSGINEPIASGVACVAQEHSSLEPARSKISPQSLNGFGMLLGTLKDVNAHVGLVEGEEHGLGVVIRLHVFQVGTDRLADLVPFFGIDARPPPAPAAARGQGPARSGPDADDRGDILPGQLLRHLHRLADAGVQCAGSGGLDGVGVLVGLPSVQRHRHAAPGDAQVLQVVLNLGRIGRALNAEIAAHAVVLAARPRGVDHEPGEGLVNFTRGLERESGADYFSVGQAPEAEGEGNLEVATTAGANVPDDEFGCRGEVDFDLAA